MMGSDLYGNIDDLHTHWYCPKTLKNEPLWVNERFVPPPMIGCLGEYIKVEWDEEKQIPRSREKTEVYTSDYGGLGSIKYIDFGVLGKHFIPDLITIIKRLESEGYQERVDLFGAPYDWRMNPLNMEEWMANTKKLIEDIYEQNNQQPVRMYGISAGCMAIHLLLTRAVDQAWKDKYIHEVLLHVPSIGGAGSAIIAAFEKKVNFLPDFINTKPFREMIGTIPTMYAHLPNFNANKGVVFVEGPNGEQFFPEDLPKFILEHNYIPEASLKIFNATLPYIERELPPLGVPTYILINTAIKTQLGARFVNGYDKKYEPLYGLGDNTVPKSASDYLCNNWHDGKPIVCHDLNIDDMKFGHAQQMNEPSVVEIIWQVFKDDSWQVQGTHRVEGNHTKGWKTLRAH